MKGERKKAGKRKGKKGGERGRKKGGKCERGNHGKKERKGAGKERDENSGNCEGGKGHLDGDKSQNGDTRMQTATSRPVGTLDGDGEIAVGIRTPRWRHHEGQRWGWRHQNGNKDTRMSLWKHWDWHGDT